MKHRRHAKERQAGFKPENPTIRPKRRHDSRYTLQKAFEAASVEQAVRRVFLLHAERAELRRDALSTVAQILGVSRSSLGAWCSRNGDNWITSKGMRAFQVAFQRAGKSGEAAEFARRILSDPLGPAADYEPPVREGGEENE